jgi:hypothetical protein
VTQEQSDLGQGSATPQRVLADRYVLLEELGRGGMGVVWLADDKVIARRVAIKELHLPGGVAPEERAVVETRVLREARAAGRLNDPGVVTVYDVLQEHSGAYIVMELIEAPTLSAVVTRECPFPQDVVDQLAEQLLSALEAAHAAGIVHRDVKPSNVMVLPSGRVKLTDFGIAQSADDTRLTSSDALVGSPSYIAPERLRGGEADAGSDLWALGAVLFYAVEGYGPFERSSTAATMHAILNDEPQLTRCQGPLASVIMGLLSVAPQDRPTPVEIRRLLAKTTPASPGTPQTSRPTRKVTATKVSRPMAATVTAAVAAVAAAAIAGTALLWGGDAVAGRARPLSKDDLGLAILDHCMTFTGREPDTAPFDPKVNPDSLRPGPTGRTADGDYWAIATANGADPRMYYCETDGDSSSAQQALPAKNVKAMWMGGTNVGGKAPHLNYGWVGPDVATLEVAVHIDKGAYHLIDAEVVGGVFAYRTANDDAFRNKTLIAYDDSGFEIYRGSENPS